MHKTHLKKKPFIDIYNASFKFSIYADRLKTAKVKPHFEKGKIHDVLGYRPISFFLLVFFFFKILEMLTYNR